MQGARLAVAGPLKACPHPGKAGAHCALSGGSYSSGRERRRGFGSVQWGKPRAG